MSEVVDIRGQKLLYHLTSLENLDSILRGGLQPRAGLSGFTDIADCEILTKRQVLGLDRYVPFHWFAKNPFDGSVLIRRPNSTFVLISVRRELAKNAGWKVIPRHPLAHDEIQLLDFDPGFDAIDWPRMNTRDYHDPVCKSICMAERLAPSAVSPVLFFKIFAPRNDIEQICRQKIRSAGVNVDVTANPRMFHQ